jgi:hypothetical protein
MGKEEETPCEIEERLQEYSVRIMKNDILEEKENLIKLRSGATSSFDVQRWTFDVQRSFFQKP